MREKPAASYAENAGRISGGIDNKVLPGSYIVRIYRRGGKDPRMVVGVVEEVGVRGKRGFHCIEELRLILDLPPGQPVRTPRNGGNGRCGRNGRSAGNQQK